MSKRDNIVWFPGWFFGWLGGNANESQRNKFTPVNDWLEDDSQGSEAAPANDN